MTLDAVLASGRMAAMLLMTDTVKVTRVTGTSFNETTGKNESTTSTVYQGPGKLSLPSETVAREDVQGQIVTSQQPVLKLPVVLPGGASGDPGAVRTDDAAEVLASAYDPALVGRKVKVTGIQPQSHATQRRFPAEVTT